MSVRAALLAVVAACGAGAPAPRAADSPPANAAAVMMAVAIDAGADASRFDACVAACLAAHEQVAPGVEMTRPACEVDCLEGDPIP